VVECAAFQSGTRAITTSMIQAHDERGATTIVNGGTTAKWARLFGGVEEASAEVGPFCHRTNPSSLILHFYQCNNQATQEGSMAPEGMEDMPEKITGFSHICRGSGLARKLLSSTPVPLVELLSERPPLEVELLLLEEVRLRETERIIKEREEKERRELEEAEKDDEEEDEAEDDEEDED
jgi:hypothetical protein